MAKAKSAVENVSEGVADTLDSVKTKVSEYLSPELQAALLKLGKDLLVVAGDAALVKLSSGVEDLPLGTFKGIIVQVVQGGVRELRNVLHGGNVSDGVPPENSEVTAE